MRIQIEIGDRNIVQSWLDSARCWATNTQNTVVKVWGRDLLGACTRSTSYPPDVVPRSVQNVPRPQDCIIPQLHRSWPDIGGTPLQVLRCYAVASYHINRVVSGKYTYAMCKSPKCYEYAHYEL